MFLSPIDALHGDIALIHKDDVFIALSRSGETGELLKLIPYIKKRGAKVISFVSNAKSSLAKLSDYFILYFPKSLIVE